MEISSDNMQSFRGPLSSPLNKTFTSNNNKDAYVEIIPDIHNDTSAKRSAFSSSVIRNVSSQFKQVSKELIRLATLTTKRPSTLPPKGLRFLSKTDSAGWIDVEQRFDTLTAKTNGLLQRNLFGQCIGMDKESNDFAQGLFDALSRRRCISGEAINKAELKEFWDQMTDHDFDFRLQIFFDMVDKDADGRITESEVKEVIILSASANKLSITQKQAGEYAALIMEELDPNNDGYIMTENLARLLLQAPSQAVGGESQNLIQMLIEEHKTRNKRNPLRRCYEDLKHLVDKWQRAWVMLLWITVMAGLFTWKYLQYKNKKDIYGVMGHCVCMAKGAAETLKLNMALILLPVCRNTITWLRSKTKLGAVVPFNDNLNFHQVIAVGIAFGVGIHGVYHLSCDYPRLLNTSEEKYEPLKKYFGEQPSNYWWFVRGWEGVTGIIMVVLMALVFTLATPWLRRGEKNLPKLLQKLPKCLKKQTGFNTFWYSHHLFVIVYACLIIHGIKLYFTKEWYKKTTWMYLAVPVTLYGGERLLRTLRSRINDVKIIKVVVHPEKVLALYMSKPKNFKYNSGQYMFVKCAAVSPFEWHPFSITSSPGDEYLSVHIQNSGDWTQKLATLFSEVCPPKPPGESGRLSTECILGSNDKYPRVIIDGPYGAPAQDYKKYDVVLLVGLGIGTTPLISIVKDIINNMKKRDEEEEEVENSLENGSLHRKSNVLPISPSTNIKESKRNSKKTVFKTKKAYFYWVTRGQGSFDWFREVMNEVAELDKKDAIDMKIYCTSVYEEGDVRCALIEMIQSIKHAKNGVDPVTGTPIRANFAKPKWPDVYENIARDHPNSKVGVFYCGRPALIKELQQLATDFSHGSSTKFVFHKENF